MINLMHSEITFDNHFFSCYVFPGTASKVQKNRQWYGFAFVTEGCSKIIFSSGEVFVCKKNDIIFFPKGSSYNSFEINPDIPYSCYAINFDIIEGYDEKPFIIHAKNSAKFLDLFKRTEKTFRTKKQWYLLRCKSLLYEILYNIYIEYTSEYQNSKQLKIIEPSVSYIHKNYYCEELKITELAKMCKITPEYYRKIFKATYGCSPTKYIIDLRLQRANELLSSGLYTVTETMELSGYTDPSYFSRQFKKKYGVPPQSIKFNQTP